MSTTLADKQFVIKYAPRARLEERTKIINGVRKEYFLIWHDQSKKCLQPLAHGYTVEQAWGSAAKRISNQLINQTTNE